MSYSLLILVSIASAAVAGQATCSTSFQWMENAMQQSPCKVAGDLISICAASNNTVPSLSGGAAYDATSVDQSASNCACSVQTYNLLMGCQICQGGSTNDIPTWVDYSKSCKMCASNNGLFPGPCGSDVTPGFPNPIPDGLTVVPSWAQLSTSSSKFNLQAAKSAASAAQPTSTKVVTNPLELHRTLIIASTVCGGTVFILVLSGCIFACTKRRINKKHDRSMQDAKFDLILPGDTPQSTLKPLPPTPNNHFLAPGHQSTATAQKGRLRSILARLSAGFARPTSRIESRDHNGYTLTPVDEVSTFEFPTLSQSSLKTGMVNAAATGMIARPDAILRSPEKASYGYGNIGTIRSMRAELSNVQPHDRSLSMSSEQSSRTITHRLLPSNSSISGETQLLASHSSQASLDHSATTPRELPSKSARFHDPARVQSTATNFTTTTNTTDPFNLEKFAEPPTFNFRNANVGSSGGVAY